MALFAFRQACEEAMDAALALRVRAASLFKNARGADVMSLSEPAIHQTAEEEDAHRKSQLLKVILALSIAFLAILETTILYNRHLAPDSYNGLPAELFYVTLLMHIGLFICARRGRARLAAIALIAFYVGISVYCGWIWGASLPATLLAIAWSVVAASILIGPRFGFNLAICLSIALCGLALHEAAAPEVPAWRFEKVSATDIVTYSAILIFISFVSWLSNQEIVRSLRRARASERALERERDELERRVAERAEAFIASERERAEGLERAAAFGEHSRGLVHDMMNPLASASLCLERMTDSTLTPSEARSITEKLTSLSKRMRSYLDSMHERLERGSSLYVDEYAARRSDIRRELSLATDALSYLMRPRGTIISLGRCDAYEMPIDPMHAHQIFVNLAKNALEAGARRIELSTVLSSDRLSVIIENDGAPIAHEQAAKIFEQGFSTKGSTGVGLASIKRIVDRLSGSISVESTGLSTRFTISIPYAPSRFDAPPRARSEHSRGRAGP